MSFFLIGSSRRSGSDGGNDGRGGCGSSGGCSYRLRWGRQ